MGLRTRTFNTLETLWPLRPGVALETLWPGNIRHAVCTLRPCQTLSTRVALETLRTR